MSVGIVIYLRARLGALASSCGTGLLCLCLTGSGVNADSPVYEAPERAFTTAERNTVLNVLHAFEMRLDPEYYLSGDYLLDIKATSKVERARRLTQVKLRRERTKRIQENLRRQEESQRNHARLVKIRDQEHAARHAQWKAQVALHRRHRCNQYQRYLSDMRIRRLQNPEYSFRPNPSPPGC